MAWPVRVVCSPDADDLFMMWALLEGRLLSPDFDLQVRFEPTNRLNELASGDEADVLAMSVAAWPAVAARWQLLPHGGSMGEGYGPVLVAPGLMSPDDLVGQRVAVPGLTTTAYTVLRMLIDVEPVLTPIAPYELLFDALRRGDVAAGLVIHEGRLTFEREGFVALVDLGAWWQHASNGLPLPLGANAIRRDLDERLEPGASAAVSELLRASIRYGLDHRDEAISWLLAREGALRSREEISTYLDMYANERTWDYGADGRTAVKVFLEQAAAMGLVAEAEVDWAP